MEKKVREHPDYFYDNFLWEKYHVLILYVIRMTSCA